jgi:hypothetical protein
MPSSPRSPAGGGGNLLVAGDHPALRIAHNVIDLVVLVGAHDSLGRDGQVEHRVALLDADTGRQCDGRIDQRLVVGVGRRIDRNVVGGNRPHRQDHGDRRDQQPQQVDAEAARHYAAL